MSCAWNSRKAGARVPASQSFRLAQTGDEQALTFSVTPPREDAQGRLRAVAHVDGKEISTGMVVIAFPHIPPQTLFPDAAAKLERVNVALTARKIGYVMGAGDEVPEALGQFGCEVTLLSARDLAEARSRRVRRHRDRRARLQRAARSARQPATPARLRAQRRHHDRAVQRRRGRPVRRPAHGGTGAYRSLSYRDRPGTA